MEIHKMNEIKLFEDAQIRSIWNEEEGQWYFSVVDICGALSNAKFPYNYGSDLNARLFPKEVSCTKKSCN